MVDCKIRNGDGTIYTVPSTGNYFVQIGYWRFYLNNICYASDAVDAHYFSTTTGVGSVSSYPNPHGSMLFAGSHSGTYSVTNASVSTLQYKYFSEL